MRVCVLPSLLLPLSSPELADFHLPPLTRPQDVLEDVTYMNAMSDDSPKPTKAWELPDEAALADFCGRELAADPQAFALEKICQNSLGFYLVRACVHSVMVWLW